MLLSLHIIVLTYYFVYKVICLHVVFVFLCLYVIVFTLVFSRVSMFIYFVCRFFYVSILVWFTY